METDRGSQFTGGRWGFWSTLGFSLIIVILFVVVQAVIAGFMGAMQLGDDSKIDTDAFVASLEAYGFFLALSTMATTLVCTSLIVVFAAVRKGITVKRYLNLVPVPLMVLVRWLAITVIFSAAIDGLSFVLGRPLVPDFMVAAYRSAENYPLFWIAIVAAAPLFEELFFRGFLFEGLRESRLQSIGAVIVTSAAWAMIHIQYGAFEITLIMLLGLILGIAKLKTRSIYIPIAMHVLVNFLAVLQVTILVNSE